MVLVSAIPEGLKESQVLSSTPREAVTWKHAETHCSSIKARLHIPRLAEGKVVVVTLQTTFHIQGQSSPLIENLYSQAICCNVFWVLRSVFCQTINDGSAYFFPLKIDIWRVKSAFTFTHTTYFSSTYQQSSILLLWWQTINNLLIILTTSHQHCIKRFKGNLRF